MYIKLLFSHIGTQKPDKCIDRRDTSPIVLYTRLHVFIISILFKNLSFKQKIIFQPPKFFIK